MIYTAIISFILFCIVVFQLLQITQDTDTAKRFGQQSKIKILSNPGRERAQDMLHLLQRTATVYTIVATGLMAMLIISLSKLL